MPPKAKFLEGERVLCFHGPLIYEAKCLKSQVKDKTLKYFIHYAGWNKNWDEWVPESRVLKYSDVNLQKQNELLRAHEAHVKSKKALKVGMKRKGEGGETLLSPPTSPSGKGKGPAPLGEKTPSSSPQTPRPQTPPPPPSRKSTPPPPTPKPPVTRQGSQATPSPTRAKPAAGSKTPASTKGKSHSSPAPTAATNSPLVSPPAENPPRKKRRVDPTVETVSEPTPSTEPIPLLENVEVPAPKKVEIKVVIPDELKDFLVDDWDLIGRQKKLVNLPATTTVDMIMDGYLKHKLAQQKPTARRETSALEVVKGIKDYFDTVLGTQLLYKFERQQYSDVRRDHPNLPARKLYGVSHLLRLFVHLGPMLSHTTLDEKSAHFLLGHFHDLLEYLKNEAVGLFDVQDYAVATPEYHRTLM